MQYKIQGQKHQILVRNCSYRKVLTFLSTIDWLLVIVLFISFMLYILFVQCSFFSRTMNSFHSLEIIPRLLFSHCIHTILCKTAAATSFRVACAFEMCIDWMCYIVIHSIHPTGNNHFCWTPDKIHRQSSRTRGFLRPLNKWRRVREKYSFVYCLLVEKVRDCISVKCERK